MLSYHKIIYLVHIIFVAPLLIYVGYYKNKVHPKVFELLLVLGLTVLVYHAYLFYKYNHY